MDQYLKSIKLARHAGYDGFALDENASPSGLTDSDKANISAIFEAAREENLNFKLYFVLDQMTPNAEDYRYLIRTYRHHPNYFNYRGLPVVAGYNAGDVAASAGSVNWWRDEVLQNEAAVFWVPVNSDARRSGCRPTTLLQQVKDGVAPQGFSAWSIQNAPMGGGLNCLERMAAQVKAAGADWIGTFSWHYWWNAKSAIPGQPARVRSRYYEHAGGAGLARSWRSLIESQSPAWVTMLTTNDYNESYGEAVDDYVRYRKSPGNGVANFAPLGWYKDQSGLVSLNRYFIEWYKSGTIPTVTKNALFVSYKTNTESASKPQISSFVGRLGDAVARNDWLRVSKVTKGFVVPGETAETATGEKFKILAQVEGRPYGKGVYKVTPPGSLHEQQLLVQSAAVPPLVERFGEPADAFYVTAVVASGIAKFGAATNGLPYKRASINGKERNLPAYLPVGMHQIRIAPYRLGTPMFTLDNGRGKVVVVRGADTERVVPIYSFFPFSGSSIER